MPNFAHIGEMQTKTSELSYQSDSQSSKNLTAYSVGGAQGNRPSSLLVEIQNSLTSIEGNLQLSSKIR